MRMCPSAFSVKNKATPASDIERLSELRFLHCYDPL